VVVLSSHSYDFPGRHFRIGNSDGTLLSRGGFLEISINPVTGLLYVLDGMQISVLDPYTNSTIASVPIGTHTDQIAVNSRTNDIYAVDSVSDTLPVVNGTSNAVNYTLPVGRAPEFVAVNDKTNMIYVGNTVSQTLSVIDGKSNELTFIIKFNVSPSNAGIIYCNNEPAVNYTRLDVGKPISCTAKANRGFAFSSWSGDLAPLARNNSTIKFDSLQYGRLNANFIIPAPVPQISIPSEFWAPLYALIPGFIGSTLIPYYLQWRKEKRQSTIVQEHLDDIGKVGRTILEEKIALLYTNGKISGEQYRFLEEKIDKQLEKSSGSPIK